MNREPVSSNLIGLLLAAASGFIMGIVLALIVSM